MRSPTDAIKIKNSFWSGRYSLERRYIFAKTIISKISEKTLSWIFAISFIEISLPFSLCFSPCLCTFYYRLPVLAVSSAGLLNFVIIRQSYNLKQSAARQKQKRLQKHKFLQSFWNNSGKHISAIAPISVVFTSYMFAKTLAFYAVGMKYFAFQPWFVIVELPFWIFLLMYHRGVFHFQSAS